MASIADSERSARLLDEARNNYSLLKERFITVNTENERLRAMVSQIDHTVENDRNDLKAEYAKSRKFLESVQGALIEEQRQRDADFEAFKTKTLSEVESLYKQQLEHLTTEMSTMEERYSVALTEVEGLMEALNEERSVFLLRERDHRNEIHEMRNGLEQQISELSMKIRDEFHTEDELNHLKNEIAAQRSVITALNDEKAETVSKLTSVIAGKDGELRKLRDQVFEASKKRSETDMMAQKSKVELSALQKTMEITMERERQLEARLSATEVARIKFESETRQRETDREILLAEAQSNHEMQAKRLEKKVAESVLIIKAKDAEIKDFQRQLKDCSRHRDAFHSNANLLRQTVANLEATIERDRMTFKKRLDEITHDRDFARKNAEDIISKSKVDQYLNEIDELKEQLAMKNDEMIQTKLHYRGLLSKMKRAVEKAHLNTPNTR